MRDIPGYRDIFGPSPDQEKPWAERLDTILTGMGIVGASSHPESPRPASVATAAYDETGDFIRERLVQEADVSEAKLAHLIYGDIGGWLIERPNLEAEDRRLVASLNQGWTGVKGTHFASVARQASSEGAPGVILVVAGAAKAPMVWELVRRGFVNQLLIESTLASALKPR